MLVSQGQQLYSASGRKMSLVPRQDVSTPGKRINSLKRLNKWLLDEAIAEAESQDNDWFRCWLKGINPNRKMEFTRSDCDTIHYIIFGDVDA